MYDQSLSIPERSVCESTHKRLSGRHDRCVCCAAGALGNHLRAPVNVIMHMPCGGEDCQIARYHSDVVLQLLNQLHFAQPLGWTRTTMMISWTLAKRKTTRV